MRAALSTIGDLLAFAPVWVCLKIAGLLPFRRRAGVGAAFLDGLTAITPPFRKRIEGNLRVAYPDLTDREVAELRSENARWYGRTTTEILFSEDHVAEHMPFDLRGPGLEIIERLQAEGRGVLLLTGHFGQWDAARIALKERGLETGLIYRPNNNAFFEPWWLRGIKVGGQPIFPKGNEGLKALIKHLRAGGRAMMLADQDHHGGERLPLLGLPSRTTLSPGRMALRHGFELMTVWCVRNDPEGRIEVTFEDLIPRSTPEAMMTEFNARLTAQIEAHREQWLWAHNRWKA